MSPNCCRAVKLISDEGLPDPEPDQVIVKLTLSSVPQGRGRVVTQGASAALRSAPPPTPFVGHIYATGRGVATTLLGRRVASACHTVGPYIACAVETLAELPDAVSDSDAARLCGYPFQAACLVDRLDMGRDEYLALVPAETAVALVILQLAAIRGFRTISVVSHREHVLDVARVGGSVVMTSEDPLWPFQLERLRAIHDATKIVGCPPLLDTYAQALALFDASAMIIDYQDNIGALHQDRYPRLRWMSPQGANPPGSMPADASWVTSQRRARDRLLEDLQAGSLILPPVQICRGSQRTDLMRAAETLVVPPDWLVDWSDAPYT